MNDIDLNNQAWTPIGLGGNSAADDKGSETGCFLGTFDGNHKTISNLKVTHNNDDRSFAGLFGTITVTTAKTVTIKDVTVSGVDVNSEHMAAGILARYDGVSASAQLVIDGCSVVGTPSKNTITSTPFTNSQNKKESGNQAAGIVGSAFGNGGYTIQNCSVSGVTIQGTRDLGAIAGAFLPSGSSTFDNNSASNCTITQVYPNDLESGKDMTAVHELVGRTPANWEVPASNTATNVTVNLQVPGVAKIGNTGYPSLAAAVAAAQSGATIELIADDDISLTSGGEIEINKPLTITGATDSYGEPKYTVYGTPTYTGTYNDIFIASTTGTVTISNISFSNFSDQVAQSAQGRAVLFIGSANNNAVIENVYISDINTEAIRINGGTFSINGCAIDCDKDGNKAYTRGIFVTNQATGSITNTDISNVVSWGMGKDTTSAIELQGDGPITISGCHITAAEEKSVGIIAASAYGLTPGSSSVIVNNCTVSAYIAVSGDGDSGAQVTVNGGEYAGYLVQGDNGTGITLTGGLYEVDPSDFIPDGYKVYTLSGGLYDGWYLVFEDNGGSPIATTYGADFVEEVGAW